MISEIPAAAPPTLPRCKCPTPEPGDVTVWIERPLARTGSEYVEREWCENCDGWIRAREFPTSRLGELDGTLQELMRWALAREMTARRARRSRAQLRRRR